MASPTSDKNPFISPEKLSGLLLLFSALLALAIKNSGFEDLYDKFLVINGLVQIEGLVIDKPLLLWVNDGWMAIFFFLIGLEIKREVVTGELSSLKRASLPIIAAIGGIVVPALFYVGINYQDPIAMEGWAVPVATDIAFALGILALVGSSVPKELKILLLSIAIIDDVVAVLIIAFFYTEGLSVLALSLMSIGLVTAIIINVSGVKSIIAYMLVGAFIWVCVLKSGVHATLAGVMLAMCIPLEGKSKDDPSPLAQLEHALHPWVFFLIMPMFAFTNSGVDLRGFDISMLTAGIPLGIILGLFVGKQLGIFSFIWLAIKTGICQKPNNVTWLHLYGMSLLTGIGFTMSLFIGALAYTDYETISQVRLGVLVASGLSAIVGFLILKMACKQKT